MRTTTQSKKDRQEVGKQNVLAALDSFDLHYEWNIFRFIRYLEEFEMEKDTSIITKDEIKRYIVYFKVPYNFSLIINNSIKE